MRHGRSHVAGICPCAAYADDMLMKPSDLVLLMLCCCTEGRKSSTDQLPMLHSLCVVCVWCTYPAMCAVLLWSAFGKRKLVCAKMLVHVVVVSVWVCAYLLLCLIHKVASFLSCFQIGLNLIADNVDVLSADQNVPVPSKSNICKVSKADIGLLGFFWTFLI